MKKIDLSLGLFFNMNAKECFQNDLTPNLDLAYF